MLWPMATLHHGLQTTIGWGGVGGGFHPVKYNYGNYTEIDILTYLIFLSAISEAAKSC